MSHRKFIVHQHENSSQHTSSTVVSVTTRRNKRPAEDEQDDDKSRSAKRRNIRRVANYTQDSISYQCHTDIQGNHEQVSISPIPLLSPNKAPTTLRIDVSKSNDYSVSHLAQPTTTSPYAYYSSLYPQTYARYYSPNTPDALSDRRFLSSIYPSSPSLPSPSSKVTRSIIHASSSDNVQWHRTDYGNHTHPRDPNPPRQYANSPNSPLFLPSAYDGTYLSEREGVDYYLQPGTARSMSPEPLSYQEPNVSGPVLSSSLESNASSSQHKRRALIIVLEYRDGQVWKDGLKTMAMQGSYKDGEDIYNLLVEQGYCENDITVMSDSPGTPLELQPTCMNIKYHLERLVAGAARGDRFFLYYAGHGIQVKDTNGDEADELDEAIIPSDWATRYGYSDEGLVIDDYLKEVCVNPLPEGANLTAVFDCCHSGTIMDLTYEHSAKTVSMGFELDESTGLSSRRLPSRYKSVDGHVVCISACEDNQKAFAHERGLLTEAFTRCIRDFVQSHKSINLLNPTLKQLYEYLLQHGRPDPKSKYIQDPMLATTFRLSVDQYHCPLLI